MSFEINLLWVLEIFLWGRLCLIVMYPPNPLLELFFSQGFKLIKSTEMTFC
jgi:hypothetical protein